MTRAGGSTRHTTKNRDGWWYAGALALRALTIAGTLAATIAWARVSGADRTRDWLTLWDAQWYARIAAFGYPRDILVAPNGDLILGHEFAFFPLFPGLAHLLHVATGCRAATACLAVALVASLALGPVTYAVARGEGLPQPVALVAVGLLATVPMPVVLTLGYAEPLFLLLSLLALLSAQRRRWGFVGLTLVAASLTRPSGLVTAAGVVAYALVHWRRRCGTAREVAAILAAGVAGVAGVVAFWAYVARRSGRLAGWFEVQDAGWRTHLDGGASTWEFVHRLLVVHDLPLTAALPTAAILVVAVGLVGLTLVRGDLRPYAAWLLLGFLTTVGSSNFWYSKPRLLLVMAVAVVPVAVAARRRLTTRPGLLLVAVLALAQLGFGLYLALSWPYAI